MSAGLRPRGKNPYKEANIFSRLSFLWMVKIFRLGYRREIQESDLFSPLESQSSYHSGKKLYEYWRDEERRCKNKKRPTKPRLFKSLIRYFGGRIILIGLAQSFLTLAIRLPQPIYLRKLIRYFNGVKEISREEAYVWGSLLILSMTIYSFFNHSCMYAMMHMGMKLRVACSSLLFRKILKTTKRSIETDSSTGQVVNFLSNDLSNFDYSMFGINYLWIAPIQVILISYVLYQEVGVSAFLGMGILISTIPLEAIVYRWSASLATKFSVRTDERLGLMSEIINGLSVIKMYTWEKPFALFLNRIREREIRSVKYAHFVSEIVMSFETYVPRLCVFATIFSYILLGSNITASAVYMVTNYFNDLKFTIYICFGYTVQYSSKTFVALRRIEEFLLLEEIEYDNTKRPIPKDINTERFLRTSFETSIPSNVDISLKDFTARWSTSSTKNTLKKINFVAKTGSLNAVIGPVGSGKSSLLLAILRELPMQEGTINTRGKIAFSSQEPWIFSANIQENIIFGRPMKQVRYNQVIKACQLERDLSILPFGDRTIVGEKGVNLSGGQRARINLARAVYAEADIYLLDDPLSAIDVRVGRNIFRDCIEQFLSGKTRILVTHQLQHLKKVDRIFVLRDGIVELESSYAELQRSQGSVMKMLQAVDEEDAIRRETIKKIEDSSLMNKDKYIEKDEEPKEVEETRSYGSVSGSVYISYFRAVGNIFMVLAVIFFCLAFTSITSGTDKFLAIWTNEEEDSIDDGEEFSGRRWYVYVYCGLTIAAVTLVYIKGLMFYTMCMRSSRNLHNKMFESILQATMSFLNSNSPGRIINRFSKDVVVIDRNLPWCLLDFTNNGLAALSAVIITVTVNPWFIIPTIITGIICYLLRVIYLATSRSVKRLEATTRSPIFNYVGSTIQGLATIRAFNSEELVSAEFDNRMDLNSTAYFIFLSASRSFGFAVEMAYVIYSNILIILFFVIDDPQFVENFGLVITQCLAAGGALQWCLRQSAEVENQMTSVERILEYSQLEQEHPLETKPENEPPRNWPSEGRIQFENVKLRYNRDGEVILKDLCFTIQPMEKIGIVGRTGSGKSSLIAALFRLAYIEGEIYIDQVATSWLGLRDLRSKMSIIPQEPVLFAGTLRMNLDPFGEYTDGELWCALEEVELKKVVMEVGFGLNMRVSGDGANFSLGQKQLLCLARAIVRKNKILVMDEATANIDQQTDRIIQETIRRRFEDCTVLIIAHRLNTVMDCDRFIVMDAGSIVEFDKPQRLLENQDGFFYNMMRSAGTVPTQISYEKAQISRL